MKANAVFLMIRWIAFICLCNATFVGVSSAAGSDHAKIQAIIIQRQKTALEAFKTHDKTSYTKLCLPDFYEITSEGVINTLQDQLKELDDYVLGDYRMEDVAVTVVSSTVALIRYKIAAQYSYKGKVLPVETMLASAVWIKSGGDWRAATFQEVKVVERR
ncbi:MAG: DUF4440 domain-containing protein [Betaproteobacteria bacterium]